MLDRGGSGGSGWEDKGINIMWMVLENQLAAPYSKLAESWDKTHQLMSEHIWRVQMYRDKLAQAWSPESSTASARYIERLEALIADLKKTQDAALANHQAMKGVAGAIRSARTEVEKHYKNYMVQHNQILDFTAAKDAKKTTWNAEPPFTADQQRSIELLAAAEMNKLSAQLSEAQVKIVKPPKPEKRPGRTDGEANGSDTGPQPVVIPPVLVAAPHDNSSGTDNSRNSLKPPFDTEPAPSAKTPTSGVIGPTLEGAKPPIVTPAEPPKLAPHSPPPSPGPSSPLGAPMARPSLNENPANRSATQRSHSTTAPAIGGPNSGRGTMPGGVIGGNSATPRTGNGAVARPNPIGGLIGGVTPNGGVRPGVSNAVQPMTGISPMSTSGSRGGSHSGDDTDSRWDPDNPWEVEQGVPPILDTPVEQRLDPGPAIGLER